MLDLLTLGSEIAKRRKEFQLTQSDLAERARLSRQTVAKLETGTLSDLGFNKVMRLLSVLHLDLHQTTANVGRPTLEDIRREPSA